MEKQTSKLMTSSYMLTLKQAVTSSTPIYVMQMANLFSRICDNLDKRNKNFPWRETSGKRKIHLINWDNVCKPKYKGDLGIKKTVVHEHFGILKKSS